MGMPPIGKVSHPPPISSRVSIAITMGRSVRRNSKGRSSGSGRCTSGGLRPSEASGAKGRTSNGTTTGLPFTRDHTAIGECVPLTAHHIVAMTANAITVAVAVAADAVGPVIMGATVVTAIMIAETGTITAAATMAVVVTSPVDLDTGDECITVDRGTISEPCSTVSTKTRTAS